MKKTLVGRNRVDSKHYGGQQQHRTAHQQKNLSGFVEMGKFTFKSDPVAPND